MTDNPELLKPLRFLREREIVHYQRFGECLTILQSMIPNNNARYTLNENANRGCGCNN